MKITDKYVFFWAGPWSNWAMSPFTIEGMTFNCVEQYMMYKKAMTFADYQTADAVMETIMPNVQKALGRRVKGYDDAVWSRVRYDIVRDGVREKIRQNKDLQLIMEPQIGKTFVEASPYDKVWGIGFGVDAPNIEDESTWNGLNLLGKALTEVSLELKAGLL